MEDKVIDVKDEEMLTDDKIVTAVAKAIKWVGIGIAGLIALGIVAKTVEHVTRPPDYSDDDEI